jgi:hypothetical protein
MKASARSRGGREEEVTPDAGEERGRRNAL